MQSESNMQFTFTFTPAPGRDYNFVVPGETKKLALLKLREELAAVILEVNDELKVKA